jgi:hypothetical protein
VYCPGSSRSVDTARWRTPLPSSCSPPYMPPFGAPVLS